MRFFESEQSRSLLVAGALVAATTLAIGVTEIASRRITTIGGYEVEPMIELHVKVRVDEQLVSIAGASAPRLMFSNVDALPSSDDRARWYTTYVSAADAERIVDELVDDPAIEYAFIAPKTELPTVPPQVDLSTFDDEAIMDGLIGIGASNADDDSCPIHTPSFESYQGYLGPAPHGIDAPAAWRRDLRGQGVWFADIEGGWNDKHEDLPGDRIQHVGGEPIPYSGWREHGTAVLGEVVGRNNGLGVVGIAPDVERVFTSSIGGTTVAAAIDTAANALRPGDVLLIELQSSGPRGRWIPVEYWPDVFETIKRATSRGVVVIEAAGNGGESLDHRAYEGRFDPKKRDSGAIMIGAGGPPRPGFTDRERLDFSNFGARVNVQGWGRMVATLDYGDLQNCDDPGDRHYTNQFSGTSSASPIVAGAAVLVEQAARAKGAVLTPNDLRRLLIETGTPQVNGGKEHIGPRPDLSRALRALETR